MKINLAKLKSYYRQIPYPFTLPLMLVPFHLFCGSHYRHQLVQLQAIKQYTPEQKNQLRTNLLIQYANEAIEFTPFYRDVAKRLRIGKIIDTKQLLEFPLLCKEQLTEELDRFTDTRYIDNRYVVTTGGTTGGQTRLYMSNDCYGKEWAFVNDLLIKQGVNPDSRRLCLRGVEGIPPDRLIAYNPLYKEMLVSPFRLSQDQVIRNLATIRRFKPQWIHGYPSSVAEFARILTQLGETLPSVTHVLLVSEGLYPEQEAQIRLVFGGNILTFYGMTERVIFAEKIDQHLFPHPLYGATEVVDGELIATGFLNKATRMIRYRTGDNANVVQEGGFVTKINSITGRRGREFLLGKNGVQVNMTALNVHNDLLDSVTRYQFYQKQPGKCILKLQTRPDFEPGNLAYILRMFQNKVGNELDIEGEIVSEIPLTQRGKHRYIVTELT